MSRSRRRDDDPYDAWGQDTRVPLEERRQDEETTPGMDEFHDRVKYGTRIESESRPWRWCAHVYVDEADLQAWPQERLDQLRDGMNLLRAAVAGETSDEDAA